MVNAPSSVKSTSGRRLAVRKRLEQGLKDYRVLRLNLAALEQSNIGPGQLPNLLREYRLWVRLTRNMKELEGSWSGAVRRFLLIFQGRSGPQQP